MKPQGIIFLPVLFFELVREKNLLLFIKCTAAFIITSLIIILPLSHNQNTLWIFNLYYKSITEYPYASVNGFNFFNLMGGNYKQSSSTFILFSYKLWGLAAITAVTLFSWYIYMNGKDKSSAFLTALIQITGVFTFSTGMHERYLFTALALSVLCCTYMRDKRFFTLCIGYSITIYGNIYYILFGNSEMAGLNSSSHSIVSDGISIMNIILFFYLIKISVNLIQQSERIEKI